MELIDIGIDPDTEGADFHVFLIVNLDAPDYPFTDEGYIPLFKTPQSALDFLEGKEDEIHNLPVSIPQERLFCDVNQTMYLLQSEDHDDRSTVLNFLNVFFDLAQASSTNLPIEYKAPLYDFANHLTLDPSFDAYFVTAGQSRTQIINGVIWLVGSVFSNAKII